MKCLCAATRRAARHLTRYYEDSLRLANLTPAQFELLGTIFARPGISQSHLAEALSVDQTTLSRNFGIVIGRKWVKRIPCDEDRRQATYTLTSTGRRAWHRALPHWQTAQEQMQRSLGHDWKRVWLAIERLNEAASNKQRDVGSTPLSLA